MNVGDSATVTGWSTERDGDVVIEQAVPPVTTEGGYYVRYPDGRVEWFPARYITRN